MFWQKAFPLAICLNFALSLSERIERAVRLLPNLFVGFLKPYIHFFQLTFGFCSDEAFQPYG